MKWPGPLIEAVFLQRYKRFLADFRLADGRVVTAHCANTGSMATCMEPNAPSRLTFHDDPKRKLQYSWQTVLLSDGWVGINTSIANGLVKEGVTAGVIGELSGYDSIAAEQRYGEGSRIDLLLKGAGRRDCYVEVKNVTLLLEAGVAGFPDAVTQRGAKHLDALCGVIAKGCRAVLLYCVQRESARKIMPAEGYDPHYARTLRQAAKKGLEIYAYRADFQDTGIRLATRLPVYAGAVGQGAGPSKTVN